MTENLRQRLDIIRHLLVSSGGQRFVLTLGCGIICSLLLVHKDLDMYVFRDLILGTVGTFVAARTYQKVAEIKAGKPGPSE